MGKGQKPRLVLAVDDKKAANEKGCNAPTGCKLNENPPIDCSRNPDYMKVICNNEKCSRNQYLHRKCFEEWEAKMIMGVQKSQSRARDFTDEQVRRRMWTRLFDVSCRHCKCACGGYLKRADVLELVEPPEAPVAAAAAAGGGKQQQRNEPKKKQQKQPNAVAAAAAAPKPQPLPKLNQASRHTYTNNKAVSPWIAAGGGFTAVTTTTHHFNGTLPSFDHQLTTNNTGDFSNVGGGKDEKTTAAVEDVDNYIPGLFVDKKKKDQEKKSSNNISNNQRKLSVASSHGEELFPTGAGRSSNNSNDNRSISRSSVSPPLPPILTPSPTPQDDRDEQQDDDWHVYLARRKESGKLIRKVSQEQVEVIQNNHHGDLQPPFEYHHHHQREDEENENGNGNETTNQNASASAAGEMSKEQYDDYKSRLEAHTLLSETTGTVIYDRQLFEIEYLLDEMSAALLNPDQE